MALCRLSIIALVWLGLFAPLVQAQTPIRIMTWNIETVGSAGSTEYQAALAVLARIGADVVALNEIASLADTSNLEQLATQAGYPHLVYSSGAPFGSDRNAILSRHPFVGPALEHTASSLSGDPAANDMTRLFLEAVVDVPGDAVDLTLLAQHWKSGTGNDDEFRRAIESMRIGQAIADLTGGVDAYVITGDVNEESDSVPRTPNPFTSMPSGLPASFSLGADLAAQMAITGIPNDPFEYLESPGAMDAAIVTALQLDGSDATRPSSGRRLDYVLVSDALGDLGVASEVYDSQDEGLPGGLAKFGSPLAASTATDASDHFPVFADLVVPAQPIPVPALRWPGIGILLLLGSAVGWSRSRSTAYSNARPDSTAQEPRVQASAEPRSAALERLVRRLGRRLASSW